MPRRTPFIAFSIPAVSTGCASLRHRDGKKDLEGTLSLRRQNASRDEDLCPKTETSGTFPLPAFSGSRVLQQRREGVDTGPSGIRPQPEKAKRISGTRFNEPEAIRGRDYPTLRQTLEH